MIRRGRRALLAALSLVCGATAFAQLKPLDHSVYDSWKSIGQRMISNDGKFAAYSIAPQEGDSVFEIRSLDSDAKVTIPRLSGVTITDDSTWLIGTQVPLFLEARQARRDKKKPEDQPKNNLVIVHLPTLKVTTLEKIQNWSVSEKGQKWVLYRPEAAPPAKPTGASAVIPDVPDGGVEDVLDQAAPPQAPTKPADPKKPETPKKKADHPAGSAYVLRNLATGAEIKLENVSGSTFAKDGSKLLLTLSTKTGDGDGIVYYDLTKPTPAPQEVVKGLGRYTRVSFSEEGDRAVFSTDKDDYSAKSPSLSIYTWTVGDKAPVKVEVKDLQKGWEIAPTGRLGFSKKATALFLAVRPKPEEPGPVVPDDEKVSLDVWNWQDGRVQLSQLKSAEAEKNRTYDARIDLRSGAFLQLEDLKRRQVSVPGDGDATWGLVSDPMPYERQNSWTEGKVDYSILDLKTGALRPVAKGINGMVTTSPSGRWVVVVDDVAKTITTVNPLTGESQIVAKSIPGLFNEEDDHPQTPAPYGFGGWVKGEDSFLIFDRRDIWSVDATGRSQPVNVTRGLGKALKTEFRPVVLDSEQEFFDPAKPLTLVGTSDTDKTVGYWKGDLSGKSRPTEMIVGPYLIGGLIKSKGTDRVLYSKQDFDVYPDIWQSELGSTKEVRLTDANPQQKEYLWGKSELIHFTSNDGVDLDGILIKPGGFDPSKQYPMVVYFYERESDRLHAYSSPSPSASTINPSYFASNGYVVFIPDIPYKVGYPGESAANAILPGVQKVLSLGFVDPKKVGLQGQSWGGYQTAYLITESNMFAAACAGAPVANMFSAYGGIRYGSGVLRQFQYEIGQSRLGKTIWDAPMLYYENSPLFYADKVKTPLLIMSNDQDGAVPHTEGIQLFSALRRLEKPVWMLVYNGEDHNLMLRKNRKDFTIRLSQFFDHYLKGAPMPVWMADGIPAVQKGRTMGLELKSPPKP